jgi:hypothetical protein
MQHVIEFLTGRFWFALTDFWHGLSMQSPRFKRLLIDSKELHIIFSLAYQWPKPTDIDRSDWPLGRTKPWYLSLPWSWAWLC